MFRAQNPMINAYNGRDPLKVNVVYRLEHP